MSDIGIFTRRRIISPAESYFAAPAAAVGGGALTWTATLNSAEQVAAANPVTFTSAALGATDPTRITIVLAHCTTNGQTGMTIGGLTATEAVHEFTAISGLGIWYCNTSSLGTTANIVISSSGNMDANSIQVGQIINCNATPTFTNSAASAFSPSSIAVTVPSGGIGIVGVCTQAANGAPTSWTNATEDYTFTTAGGMTRALAHAAASATVSYTFTGGGTDHMVAAAWGP